MVASGGAHSVTLSHQFISVTAVVTNTLIIYLKLESGSSPAKEDILTLMPWLGENGIIWVVVALEHMVFMVKMALRAASSESSAEVSTDQFREEYFHLKRADVEAGRAEDFSTLDEAGVFGAEVGSASWP